MVWPATENFDSYTVDADLNGGSGGSGWSGNWSLVSGTITTPNAPAGGQGGNAAKSTGLGGEDRYNRAISAITAGTVRFRARLNTTTPNIEVMVRLLESGTARMAIQFDAGNIKINNNGTLETIQAFSADTWYTIDVDFDDSAQPNLYRARVDGGTYTAYKTTIGGGYTNIDAFQINHGSTGAAEEFWVDAIEPTPSTTSATVLLAGRRRRV